MGKGGYKANKSSEPRSGGSASVFLGVERNPFRVVGSLMKAGSDGSWHSPAIDQLDQAVLAAGLLRWRESDIIRPGGGGCASAGQ